MHFIGVVFSLLGIAIGHIYYFLEDVFPEQAGGFKILRTPGFMWVMYMYVHCTCCTCM